MRWVSVLGDEPAFTCGLPLLAWSVELRAALVVVLAWAGTFYLGHALKDLLQLPRPFVLDKRVVCLEARGKNDVFSFFKKHNKKEHFRAEFGLPSTHAQAAWALPGTALGASWAALEASSSARAALLALALLFALSVSFSRLYLGVHSLLDVAAGALLGLLSCAAALLLGPALAQRYLALSAFLALPGALLLHALLLRLYPRLPGLSSTFRDTCAVLGVSLGVWWAARLRALLPLPAPRPLSAPLWLARALCGLLALLLAHLLVRRLVRALLARIWPSSSSSSSSLEQSMTFVASLKFVSYIGIGFNSLGIVPVMFYFLNLY
jgi:sphingosine-1-phosphate phosphatase 1